MDAGDAETYAKVRPPHGGPPRIRSSGGRGQVANVGGPGSPPRAASPDAGGGLDHPAGRRRGASGRGRGILAQGDRVDEVITRKFLDLGRQHGHSLRQVLDPHLYGDLPTERKEPCVWPFERLNVDTLGRVALCGQDIAFRTSSSFPTRRTRRSRTSGRARRSTGTGGCISRGGERRRGRAGLLGLAGRIRDWDYGWLKVLKTSGDHLKDVMKKDLGTEVEVYEPEL